MAQILSVPELVPHIGRTGWLAAVLYEPTSKRARLSSVARSVTVLP